jgi:hypothetical protein
LLGGYPTSGTTTLKQEEIINSIPSRIFHGRNRNTSETNRRYYTLFLGRYPTAGTGTPLK